MNKLLAIAIVVIGLAPWPAHSAPQNNGEIYIKNSCKYAIGSLGLHYEEKSGEWRTLWYSNIKPKTTVRLTHGHAPITSNNEYFATWAKLENSERGWYGREDDAENSRTFEFNGKPYVFQLRKYERNADGDWIIGLSCDNLD
jgi:hypothetical protein